MSETDPDNRRRSGVSRRRLLGAMSASLVGGIAGCGGDGDDTDEPTGTTEPADTTEPMETTEPAETTEPTETETTPTGTPTQDFGGEPAELVSLDSATVAVGETTTLSGTLSNPYLFELQSVEVSLDAPSDGWTVSPTGETSFDTVEINGTREVGWEVTPPEDASGDFTLSLNVSYESTTDRADLTVDQSLSVFEPGEVPQDGLIAHFPLEGEPPANAVSDSEATVGGDPVTDADGFVGGAYEFDGEDDNLSLPEFSIEGGSVSVSVWVNANDLSDVKQILFWGGPVPEHTGVELWVPQGSAPGFFYWDGMEINGIEASTESLPTGEWVHLCGVYDNGAGTWTIYVNGDEASSAQAPADISLDPVDTTLGNHPENDGQRYFDGRIDELRIYDRALAAGEVASIAN